MLRKLLLISSVLVFPTFSLAQSLPVKFTVSSSDQTVKAKLEAEVVRAIGEYNVISLAKKKFPVAEIYVYANQDVENRINPNGWTFAAAHITNLRSLKLVEEVFKDGSSEPEEIKRLAAGLMQEHGFLKHLNVAHAESLGEREIRIVIGRFISDFSERVKGYANQTAVLREQRPMAEQGFARGQLNRDGMHNKGQGIGRDHAEGTNWFRKAAEQVLAFVQYNLGVMYDKGRGVSKDHAEAVKWYMKAAENGHAGAKNNLDLISRKKSASNTSKKESKIDWGFISRMEGTSRNKANLPSDEIEKILVQLGNDSKKTTEDIIKQAQRENEKTRKDTLFVLASLGLAISNQQEKAFKVINSYNLELTYQDKLPRNKNEVLVFSYSWLINNTEFEVPCWFVQKYTNIFYSKTPYWGSTRDAYMSACAPNQKELENLTSFRALQLSLNKAYNPGGCFLGTISNHRIKTEVIHTATLLNRPDYYLKNIEINKEADWLKYWRYMGAYEYRIYSEINSHREKSIVEIGKFISNKYNYNKEIAERLSELFINNIIAAKIGSSIYAEAQEVIEKIKVFDWDSWETASLDPAPYIAGYLLKNEPTQNLINYLKIVKRNNKPNVFQSVLVEAMGMAAAGHPKSLQALLSLDLRLPNKLGGFNKSPLHYAVQYNDSKSYKILNERMKFDTETLSRDYGCGSPRIGKRNVLTYAAENADENLLQEVINDFGPKYAGRKDTDGRNIRHYLNQNVKITARSRRKFIQQLSAMEFQ